MDCDGRIDHRDALAVLRRLAHVPGSGGCAGSTDVDCDGVTDVLDALAILRHAARLSAAEAVCS